MTSTTAVPPLAVAEDAVLDSELSDAAQESPVADEEEKTPPADELPPIPNIFKDSVSAARWADMTVVARAVHINIGSRSMRNIHRQEAKKSLVRQQDLEDKETRASVAAAETAATHATQQASAAVRRRNDLRSQFEAAERAAREALSAVDACDAELAAEERRAATLLAKRRRTDHRGRPIPRQPLPSPHLRCSASRSASPSPPELDQAPSLSSGGAVSAYTPEGGAYVYDNDRKVVDGVFLDVLITDFASYPMPSFTVEHELEVKACAAALARVTDANPFATLEDVLTHTVAVADTDHWSVSSDGYCLLMALRSAHYSDTSAAQWPRPPSVTTASVGEGGGGCGTAQGTRDSDLQRALNQGLSSRRNDGRNGGSSRNAGRRDGDRAGCSGRQSRQNSGNSRVHRKTRRGRGGGTSRNEDERRPTIVNTEETTWPQGSETHRSRDWRRSTIINTDETTWPPDML